MWSGFSLFFVIVLLCSVEGGFLKTPDLLNLFVGFLAGIIPGITYWAWIVPTKPSPELKEHYDRLNKEVFQLLSNLTLTLDSNIPPAEASVFERYRFKVTLPPESSMYDKGILHLKKQNPSISEELSSLNQAIKEHNEKVSLAEKNHGNSEVGVTLEALMNKTKFQTDPGVKQALTELEDSKSALEQRIKKITDLAAQLSKQIDAGDYKTKAKGCCGSWLD
jgi:hypothetical protein